MTVPAANPSPDHVAPCRAARAPGPVRVACSHPEVTAALASRIATREKYEAVRATWRAERIAYRRPRTVSVGVHVTLLFETWRTVLWQVHEVLYVEGPWTRARVAQEVATYAALAGLAGELTATLMVDRDPSAGSSSFGAELDQLLARRDGLFIDVGGRRVAARLIDDAHDASAVRYVSFPVGEAESSLLDGPAQLVLREGGGVVTAPLSAATRRALADDLEDVLTVSDVAPQARAGFDAAYAAVSRR